MAYDDSENIQLEVEEFSKVEYALMNRASFDLYIERKIKGTASVIALMTAFGYEYAKDLYVTHRIYMLESNPYYLERFDARLAELKLAKVWNPAMSAYSLISLVKADTTKDTVKLSAIKELNVIFGITTVDDAGRSRAVRKLDDFYADQVQQEDETTTAEEEEAEKAKNPQPEGQGDAQEG
jgi:hypothetical protein